MTENDSGPPASRCFCTGLGLIYPDILWVPGLSTSDFGAIFLKPSFIHEKFNFYRFLQYALGVLGVLHVLRVLDMINGRIIVLLGLV